MLYQFQIGSFFSFCADKSTQRRTNSQTPLKQSLICTALIAQRRTRSYRGAKMSLRYNLA